jgi:transposase-like protein
MVLQPVKCPLCGGIDIIKHGKAANDKQRFICQATPCQGQTFILDYSDQGRLPEIKQKIVAMALNGSGSRDTARVLGSSTATVSNALKKAPELPAVNQALLATQAPDQITVAVIKVEEIHEVTSDDGGAVAMDEMWSYVGNKGKQRWLWHALDRATGRVLA